MARVPQPTDSPITVTSNLFFPLLGIHEAQIRTLAAEIASLLPANRHVSNVWRVRQPVCLILPLS